MDGNFLTFGAHMPQHVRDALEWVGRSIVTCENSIEWIAGQRDGDRTGDKRAELPAHIERLMNMVHHDAALLVKGQDLDLKANRLRKTRNLLLAAKHRIIYIRCDPDEQWERWQKKWWFDAAKYDLTTVVEWQNEQTKMLLEHEHDGFPIVCFHGGAGRNYEPSSLPPPLP